MDIEAHTLTHPDLSKLTHEQAVLEITKSKILLENQLNKPVTILAYPFGCYNEDVMAVTKAAGYEAAAAVSGINKGYLFRKDKSYALERYAIEGNEDLGWLAHVKGFDTK